MSVAELWALVSSDDPSSRGELDHAVVGTGHVRRLASRFHAIDEARAEGRAREALIGLAAAIGGTSTAEASACFDACRGTIAEAFGAWSVRARDGRHVGLAWRWSPCRWDGASTRRPWVRVEGERWALLVVVDVGTDVGGAP